MKCVEFFDDKDGLRDNLLHHILIVNILYFDSNFKTLCTCQNKRDDILLVFFRLSVAHKNHVNINHVST